MGSSQKSSGKSVSRMVQMARCQFFFFFNFICQDEKLFHFILVKNAFFSFFFSKRKRFLKKNKKPYISICLGLRAGSDGPHKEKPTQVAEPPPLPLKGLAWPRLPRWYCHTKRRAEKCPLKPTLFSLHYQLASAIIHCYL